MESKKIFRRFKEDFHVRSHEVLGPFLCSSITTRISHPEPSYPSTIKSQFLSSFHSSHHSPSISIFNNLKNYFKSFQKAYNGFRNHAFYSDNSVKAFDGFHGPVSYHNDQKVYDAFFCKTFVIIWERAE